MSEISIRSEAKKMVRQYNKTKSSNVRSLTKRTDCGYLNQKKYQAFKKALQALEFEHLCETFFPTQCNARLSPGIYPPIVSTMISLDGFSAANYLQIKPCWSVRLGLFVQDLKNKKIAQAFSLFTKNTKSKYL